MNKAIIRGLFLLTLFVSGIIQAANLDNSVIPIPSLTNTSIGLSKVVLIPNMEKGVNTLRQEMIKAPNTIYCLEDAFVLGEDITIPSNCVLEFDGGSIIGKGYVKGNETTIKADILQIFGTDILLIGSWNNSEAYPEWFGAKGNGVEDDTKPVTTVLSSPFPLVSFCKKYKVSESLYVGNKSIRGISADNSTIIYTGKGVAIFFGCYQDDVYSGLSIRDLSIIGNKSCQCGLHIQNVWRCNFDNVVVSDVLNGVGIKTYSTANNGFYWNNFKNCHLKNIEKGVVLDSDRTKGASNANSILNCSFHTVVNGIEVLYGDAIVIDACSFEFCSGSAIVTDSKSTKITKNRFEQNNYDITFGENCQYQFVLGNYTPAGKLWIVNNSKTENNFDISRYEYKKPGTTISITAHAEKKGKVDDMVIKLGNVFVKNAKPVLLSFFSPVKTTLEDVIWVQLRAGDIVVSETSYKLKSNETQNVSIVGMVDVSVIKIYPQEYSVYCWSEKSGNTITMSGSRIFYAQCLNSGFN